MSVPADTSADALTRTSTCTVAPEVPDGYLR